ncbi:hypothetical protein QAD02_019399, partial [Eretmocerus hayati]
MIAENQKFVLVVSHVEAEGELLKIWAQTDHKLVTTVRSMLDKIHDNTHKSEIPVPQAVMPHTFCFARNAANQFCRAKVLASRSDGLFFVQFVDYGYSQYVPIYHLRSIVNSPETAYLGSLPEAASVFILANVRPFGNTWADDVIKQIRSILVNNQYIGIYKTVDSYKLLKFYVMNQDFGDMLIQRNMAVSSTSYKAESAEYTSTVPVQPMRAPQSVSHAIQRTQPAQNYSPAQREIKPNSFKALQLEIDSVHEVYISYVEDGPWKFSVQLKEMMPFLENMMEDINSRRHEPLRESPIAGTVCLGEHSQTGKLCRVVLNSPGVESCKAYFADYGHHEILPFSKIFQIPDEFIIPSVFSIRFTLSGIMNWSVTEELKDHFGGLVAGKMLKLKVCRGPMSPLTQYCELFLGSKNIKEPLSQMYPEVCQPAYIEAKKLPLGSVEAVFVTYVETTAKFFVQIEKDSNQLNQLMDRVDQSSEVADKLTKAQVHNGMPCIARYSQDQQWYRALVCDKSNCEKIRVFYVDYGNEDVVSIEDLRQISLELVKSLPKQAIKCALNSSVPLDPEIVKYFEELVLEKTLQMKVLGTHDDINLVELNDGCTTTESTADDIAGLLKSLEISKKQEVRSCSAGAARGSVKPQQIDRTSENWRADQNQSRTPKSNGFGPYDPSTPKYRKEDENQQRYASDSRSNDHSNRSFDNDRHGNVSNDTRRSPSVNNDRFDSSRTSNSSGNGATGAFSTEKSNGSLTDRLQVGRVEKNQSGNDMTIRSNGVTHDQSKAMMSSEEPSLNSSRVTASTPICRMPPPNITIGAVKNCVMVYFTNLTNFYIQLCPDNEELDGVMDNIYAIYGDRKGKIVQVSDVRPGLHCVAQYSSDGEWYRAVVDSVDNGSAKVLFVDYGNVDTVPFDKIKELEAPVSQVPMQAVHCKLFGIKSNWTKEESSDFADRVDNKTLEAEFILEENGVYQVLVKILDPNTPSSGYINEELSGGVDVMKLKDAVRNKSASSSRGNSVASLDVVPLDQKWPIATLELGSQHEVFITWFINPHKFYCQLADQDEAFLQMMSEIPPAYANQDPVSQPLKIGSSVMAISPSDGALYRAEVVEFNDVGHPYVHFVDYGDRALVEPSKVFPVDKRFMILPKHAILCGLDKVLPATGSEWPNSDEASKFFDGEKCVSTFLENKNGTYMILLSADGNDVAKTLVDNGLAVVPISCKAPPVFVKQEPVTIDMSMLEGQNLHVRVSSVESVEKFYVQFKSAEACQAVVDSYVVVEGSEMLKLPGQLSGAQNQAVECGLLDISRSPSSDDMLKKLVSGKDVIINVESVQNTRLIVRLFDTNGQIIKVINHQKSEEISPVCNLPILGSTHKVVVTWIKDFKSIWLQRVADGTVASQLLDSMYDFYSNQDSQPLNTALVHAALSCDGNWYRVKILKTEGSEAEVVLLDYGNIEKIPTQNLRNLDPHFFLPHQLAIEVSLTVDSPFSTKQQQNILEPIFHEKEMVATLFNIKRQWIADICIDGQKLSEKLISMVPIKKEMEDEPVELVKEEELSKPETKPLQVEVIPEMVAGQKYEVYIAHSDNPNQVWLHRREEATAIDDFSAQLQDLAPTLQDCTGDLEVKSLCLAKYSLDEQWYRAEVLDSDEEITMVRFIDYGNADTIYNNKGHLKQMTDEFKSVKRYAVLCKLDVVPADNSLEWSEEACNRFKDLANPEKIFEALVITPGSPLRIDLLEGEQSISQLLIDEGLASRMSGNEVPNDEFVEEEFDPRSAFTSYTKSADEFWLQEEKNVSDLRMIDDRLLMANVLPDLQEFKKGMLCVAHYPDDNCFYRAKIVSHSDDGTEVYYIDYGNSAKTKILKVMPDDLMKFPSLTRKCRLATPDGIDQWSAEAHEEFKELACGGETVFLLDVIEEGETNLVRLTLKDGSKDVAQILVEKCEKSSKTPPPTDEGLITKKDVEEDIKYIACDVRPPPIGEENLENANICVVSYVHSPADFSIQKKSQFSILDQITERLSDVELFDEVSRIEPGKILAAKYDEDHMWYRSKVLSHDARGTEVLYFDYGNTGVTTSMSDLRELPEDLAKIPPLAIKCSLLKPDGIETWSNSTCDKWRDMVDSGMTEFFYKYLSVADDSKSDQPNIVSLFLDEHDVIDTLMNHEQSKLGDAYSPTGT